MGLNGVQVGPFGPKLGQNDAPELRIISKPILVRTGGWELFVPVAGVTNN